MTIKNSKMICRLIVPCMVLWSIAVGVSAEGKAKAEKVTYTFAPAAPQKQTAEAALEKSAGCMSCHTKSDSLNMHNSAAVVLGCTDCHGGNPDVFVAEGLAKSSSAYLDTLKRAHVLPLFPAEWNFPGSANPQRSYTLLNRESPEFIRFVNPSDYRVARESCGACHMDIIQASERSMHSTGAMLWGGASYNNGILDYKNYLLGEAYTREGEPAAIKGPYIPEQYQELAAARGILPMLVPLPAWETVNPADIFRVFERGGRNIGNLFPETGLPNALGQLQRLEEPGRPDIRQSNRGPGTGARIAVPLINITKTRLNDPLGWFIGTNDQPGDYRHSGCASCHVVYGNDRDPRHSGHYARHGHEGKSSTVDPTIDKDEEGHPIQHQFTRAIPTSQCMVCHMHQPNMFMNSYLGYTMWDYESDAPFMWPEEQQYPTDSEARDILDRNPEGAAVRGKWGDVEFLKNVSDLNKDLQDTQFADYHGHGWNFRAIFKRDRKGNLLDKANNVVADSDPDKFKKAVHMSSTHLDAGMHCVDCHFSQDGHGNGYLQGEVALAVEIDCVDCHGTAAEYPNLLTSGPAALNGGKDLSLLRTPDGRKRFEWLGGKLFQRSALDSSLEWQLSLVKDSVNPGHQEFNEKAARAKLMGRNTQTLELSEDLASDNLAHSYEELECYACHTSWTTSCGGCHLPIEANWKTERHHYEGGETRNFATYNPQVARDQMFMLGRRGTAKGGKIAPVRSSSALVLSSTNANRERIYIQQPPVAASGFSSQAFNPHFPHTVRKEETRTCSDCHVSADNDNNAIMAQLLLQGTNFVNFIGQYAWVGGAGEITGVEVTEWDEPQAVRGSYLHKYAYPDWFSEHQKNNNLLQTGYAHKAGNVGCIQLRGEYLYVAEGAKGMRVYDVASIANKGVSQRIISAPFSPLGQRTRIKSENASCVALPTNQPINPAKNKGDLMRIVNQEQPFHPIYNYAVIVDMREGLILTNVNTLADGEPRNNSLRRALTWNRDNILTGARHVTLGGHYAYIIADAGLVIVDLDNPEEPVVTSVVPLNEGRASALQFRYLLVTDADGLHALDVTNPGAPVKTGDNLIEIADARKLYIARTFAYVASGADGITIVDVESPANMKLLQQYDGGGALVDSHDIVVGSTNASLFAYVADGDGGLKVLQLTSPESQPKFYGFSPEPKPELIAIYNTDSPALSLSKGLDRDRGVDETGGQIAVFGRKGSRPLSVDEMMKMYLNKQGDVWRVSDTAE